MQATFYSKRESIRHFHMEHYKHMDAFFHFHSTVELLWVRRGAAEVWIGGATEKVEENELAVVLSYEPHSYTTTVDGEYITLFIPTNLCSDFLDAVRHKKVYRPVLRDPAALGRIQIALEALQEKKINSITQGGFIQVILGTVLSHIQFCEEPTHENGELPAQLLVYINDHYKENLSVASLAQTFGYSPHHLSECFRARFRRGIGNYINTLRLKNAVVLLQEKKKSITECAMESGFSSLRTFYRVFTEEFGCSPREFLRQEP